MATSGPKSDVLAGGFRVGDTLGGRYVLERKLGRGGMGVVLAGRRVADGQRVAIKLLLIDSASEQAPKHVARLIREAKATASLADEHVVRLYDVDTLDDGTCFLVMELLEGEDLAKHVRKQGSLPVNEAVDLILQAAAGVAEAHARGIVHRDLKPHNLFLTHRPIGYPIVKVLDFGISKVDESDDGPLTTTGAALGSPQYMAIEQFQNSKNIDRRCDIWALGMILHHLLTGRTAYEGTDLATYLFRLSTELPIPVRQHRADVPPAIESVILRCLEKNPNARYYNVKEFAQALAPFAGPRSAGAIARIGHYATATPQIAAAPAPQENLRVPASNSAYGQSPVHSGTNDAVMRENVAPTGKRFHVALGAMIAALIVVGGLAAFFGFKAPRATNASIESAPSTIAAATPTSVLINVTVTPTNATLELDGVAVKSPLEIPLEDKDRSLVVKADGYTTKTKIIRPTANAYMEITLEAVAAPSATPTAEVGHQHGPRVAAPAPAPAPAPTPTTKKKLKGPMADTL